MPQRPNPNAKFDLSTLWTGGRRTPRWDALWTRLLAHALDQSTQPETKLMATVEEVSRAAGKCTSGAEQDCTSGRGSLIGRDVVGC